MYFGSLLYITNIEQCYGGSVGKMFQPWFEKAQMSLADLAADLECLHVSVVDVETEISKAGK